VSNQGELYILLRKFDPVVFDLPTLSSEIAAIFAGYMNSLLIMIAIHG
jgi:hypothetical protein